MKTKRARWRDGIRIWCVECGRDLHGAPPEFVASHPMPRCFTCAIYGPRKAIYAGGPPTINRAEALPAAPIRRRHWWWFR